MALGAQVVSHQEQIAGLVFATFDPIRQDRLDVKAEPLKQCTRTLMIGDHLRGELVKLKGTGERHDFRAQTLAEAPRPPVTSGVDADLTDLAGPSQRIDMKARV